MPTPFYHLSLAQDLIASPSLPGQTADFLRRHWGDFLLGNTAPDVQVITNQDRELTHFFDLPILPLAPVPWEKMLQSHPMLRSPRSGSQAAFLAGYICHLAADWEWVLQIFAPVFGPGQRWASFGQRLHLHNVLRSYLDRQVVGGLSDQTGLALEQTQPRQWLPFVADQHLREWRDVLFPQLRPGAAISTIEVFAARQGVDPEEFYTLLDSPERMENEIFSHVTPGQINQYRLGLNTLCLKLIQAFLADYFAD